jgi:hypothetical protein
MRLVSTLVDVFVASGRMALSRLLVSRSVARAMLEDVGLAINRQDDGPLVRMGLVIRSDSAPNKFSGAADPIMIVDKT